MSTDPSLVLACPVSSPSVEIRMGKFQVMHSLAEEKLLCTCVFKIMTAIVPLENLLKLSSRLVVRDENNDLVSSATDATGASFSVTPASFWPTPDSCNVASNRWLACAAAFLSQFIFKLKYQKYNFPS